MAENLTKLLRTFRRQMVALRFLRWMAVVLLAAAMVALPKAGIMPAWSILLIGLGLLVPAGLLIVHSFRLAREIQAGGVLLSIGKLDDAAAWLKRGLSRFALSGRAKIMAAQLLASLLQRRGEHEDAVTVCREVLRQPLRRLQYVWVNTRLMLADSLLILGHLQEACETLRPIHGVPIPLEARLRLLPIQLRYELTAGDAGSAASELPEKVRLAELMDSSSAALTHALLAEACRRLDRSAERDFLAARANLYHDLGPLASQQPLIEPIAAAGWKR
ncbi:MAG TPA: hypothetical protein VLM89_05525 [Phycisphaerae bacterium]|nr:hypothetical protein [Phycisphaerae bacterium]